MSGRWLLAAALAAFAAPLAAQDVAITNATIGLGDGSAQRLDTLQFRRQITNANFSLKTTRYAI